MDELLKINNDINNEKYDVYSIFVEENISLYKEFYCELNAFFLRESAHSLNYSSLIVDFSIILKNWNSYKTNQRIRNHSLSASFNEHTDYSVMNIYNSISNQKEIYNIIKALNDITDSRIYSPEYIKYMDGIPYIAEDILTKIVTRIRYDKVKYIFENQFEIDSISESDILFKRVAIYIHDGTEELSAIFGFIDQEIRKMTEDELFSAMEHRYDPRFSLKINRFYGSGASIINKHYKELETEIKDYIVTAIRMELSRRISAAIRRPEQLIDGLYKEYVFIPHFFHNTRNEEVDYMIIWSWNYLVYNSPIKEDGTPLYKKEGEGIKEHLIAPTLADILPKLADYYNKRYTLFSKKYNNPKRKKIFSDQTDLYNKMDNKLSPRSFLKKSEEEV